MQLVDTNIISELMFKAPDEGVRAWMATIEASHAQLWLSVITVHEIIYGLSRKPKPGKLEWFERFVTRYHVLEVNETVARRAGEMRGQFAARGQVRHPSDMLIAATAQVHALTLVTRNVRDFDGCGIAVLNPFAA